MASMRSFVIYAVTPTSKTLSTILSILLSLTTNDNIFRIRLQSVLPTGMQTGFYLISTIFFSSTIIWSTLFFDLLVLRVSLHVSFS